MNEWMNEWMNERKEGWMNEWMNEWMNKWINEWMKRSCCSWGSICQYSRFSDKDLGEGKQTVTILRPCAKRKKEIKIDPKKINNVRQYVV